MKPVRMVYITEAECARLTALVVDAEKRSEPEDGPLLNKLYSAKERFSIALPQEARR